MNRRSLPPAYRGYRRTFSLRYEKAILKDSKSLSSKIDIFPF